MWPAMWPKLKHQVWMVLKQSSYENPPIPPRKKATNGSTSPPNNSSPRSTLERARGGGNTTREDIIIDLCSLGYSRSDIVRALAVAGNDYQLAKLILKEFGTR